MVGGAHAIGDAPVNVQAGTPKKSEFFHSAPKDVQDDDDSGSKLRDFTGTKETLILTIIR